LLQTRNLQGNDEILCRNLPRRALPSWHKSSRRTANTKSFVRGGSKTSGGIYQPAQEPKSGSWRFKLNSAALAWSVIPPGMTPNMTRLKALPNRDAAREFVVEDARQTLERCFPSGHSQLAACWALEAAAGRWFEIEDAKSSHQVLHLN
jgi:hypothetical protein